MEKYKTKFSLLEILVVDDDPVHREVMRGLLEAIGVENIEFAESGESALRKLLLSHNFHVVLLDYMMPGMSGKQLITAIRQGPFPRRLKLAMINGGGTEAEERELGKFLWRERVLHLKKEGLSADTLSHAISTLVGF